MIKKTMKNSPSAKDDSNEFELRRKKLLEFIIHNPPATNANFTPEPEEDIHALGTSEYVRNIMSKANRRAHVDKKSSQHL
jgi:predicted HTH transcriptional regulator